MKRDITFNLPPCIFLRLCMWAPVSWSANIYCIIFQYTFHFITYKLSHPIHAAYSAEYVCIQQRCYSLSALLRTHVGLGLLITFYTVRLYTMYSFTLYFMQTLLGQVATKISPVSRQMPPTTHWPSTYLPLLYFLFRTCSRQFQQYNLGRHLISVTHAQTISRHISRQYDSQSAIRRTRIIQLYVQFLPILT